MIILNIHTVYAIAFLVLYRNMDVFFCFFCFGHFLGFYEPTHVFFSISVPPTKMRLGPSGGTFRWQDRWAKSIVGWDKKWIHRRRSR